MLVRIDGKTVSPRSLSCPAMNFGQFRWPGVIGQYEMEIDRAEFIERLKPAYLQTVQELQADDLMFPDDEEGELKKVGYPPLDELPDYPAAFIETVNLWLRQNFLDEYMHFPPTKPVFMVNSIDEVSASDSEVVIRGRGYHS